MKFPNVTITIAEIRHPFSALSKSTEQAALFIFNSLKLHRCSLLFLFIRPRSRKMPVSNPDAYI
jgi:hypothetical protein